MTTNKPDNENVQHSSWTPFNPYPTCQYSFATPPPTPTGQPVSQEKQFESLFQQGNAFCFRKTPDSLRRAIELYTQAIAIGTQLPKDNPQFQNDLASAYNHRGNAQSDLGTPADLHAAIESYNQAIAIRILLPKDHPQFQNDLARVYYNRGVAQSDLGTPADLHAAIASYTQAIAIRTLLPKDNPQFQNDLASAYYNRGIAQGGLGDLQTAIESYNQAIAIGEQIPKDQPQFQEFLALAYYNRGTAQSALGTPADLHAAIESYTQAIAIGTLLPKDHPQFQNDLARVYYNRGVAQSDLGTPDDLRAAIESYNQVIAIGTQLPKDRPEFQNDLASAYNNRGNAQRNLGTPDDLHAAIESYNQAIAIREQLPKDHPQFQHDLALVFGGKANACLDLNQLEEAQEAAEAGLDLLRNLEKAGVYRFRKTREKMFGTAIETYLANFATCHFLPELLLEHLDPNQPGSAPESEVMHNDALRGLQRLYLQLYNRYPEMLPTLQQPLETLAQIRALYFVGTAAGAKLMAEHYARHLRDSQKTLATLQDYIQHNPLDPQGYVNLASVSLDNPELFPADHSAKTWESYFKAAHILSQLPTAPLVQNTLIMLLDLCIELRDVPVLFEYPYLVGGMVRDMVQHRQDLAQRWIADLPDTMKNLLGNPVALLTEFQQLRNTWETITQSDFEHWKQQGPKRLQAKRQRLETLLADLPLDIEQVHQRAAYIVQQARQWIAENASKDEPVWQAEAKMRPFLDQALQCVYRQLHGYEYEHSLFDSLGKAAYTLLDKGEFWLLRHALRLYCDYLQSPDDLLLKEVGFHLGLAVEESLLNRLYRPLKDQRKRFTVHDKDDYCEAKVVKFFNAPPPEESKEKPKQESYKLLLDPMVGMLNRLVHSNHKEEELKTVEAQKTLLERIQDHAPQLLGQSKGVQDHRNEALGWIKKMRNKCAHAVEGPQPPTTAEEVEKMLDYVLLGRPSEEAFFRYFVGAFARESK